MIIDNQLRISDLLRKLELLKNEFGDLPIFVIDADTDWYFILQDKNLIVQTSNNEYKNILSISIDYNDGGSNIETLL